MTLQRPFLESFQSRRGEVKVKAKFSGLKAGKAKLRIDGRSCLQTYDKNFFVYKANFCVVEIIISACFI